MRTQILELSLFTAIVCILLAASAAYGDIPDGFPVTRTASGRVYLDLGEGGQRPLPGVRVISGWEVAVTDEDGTYTIESKTPFNVVYVSFPDGTLPAESWFRRLQEEEETGVDFPLVEDGKEYPFLFIQYSDSHGVFNQIASALRDEAGRLPLEPKFYIGTGDIGGSASSWSGELEKFEVPVFNTPGNTDSSDLRRADTLPDEVIDHPSFGFFSFERHINPKRWSFTYRGLHFLGVEWSPSWTDRDGNPRRARHRQDTMEWVIRELESRPPGTRAVLCKHDHSIFILTMMRAGHDVTFALMGGSHTYYPMSNYGGDAYGDRIREGGVLQTQSRIGSSHARTPPPGYNIVVVEKDSIDVFHMPLKLPNDHAILVNNPVRAPDITRVRDDVETPARVTIRGQVFDVEGQVSKVIVNLGGQEAEARTTRRRFWVDYEAEVTMTDPEDFLNALTVSAAFPDGLYALKNPFKELNWAVHKVE